MANHECGVVSVGPGTESGHGDLRRLECPFDGALEDDVRVHRRGKTAVPDQGLHGGVVDKPAFTVRPDNQVSVIVWEGIAAHERGGAISRLHLPDRVRQITRAGAVSCGARVSAPGNLLRG